MGTRTIHPFPARMAPEIALKAIPSTDNRVLTVLDPMCGSGTVLDVALQRGHNAIGIDIDPLAVMMSQLTVSPIDVSEVTLAASSAVETARKVCGTAPWDQDAETEAFVDYWFASKQKASLINLLAAISLVEEPAVKRALHLAISRIIVTKRPEASLAADTSHSRPHRVQTDSEYDVISGFQRSVSTLTKMLEARKHKGVGSAQLGDARALSAVGDTTVDLAVTSPPYLNALDYLRGHKLALVWFGHTISELRQRRSASIGAERGPDRESSRIMTEIIDAIEAEAVDRSALKRPMLERFAGDCVGFASELARTVKSDGKAVLVVGNSTLRGNYIRNDKIAQMAMEHAGFAFEDRYEREIPPTSRYMAISTRDEGSSITKRMRTEVVLTMRK